MAKNKTVETEAEVEAFLIPGITIKTFEPGEETAAESWLAV